MANEWGETQLSRIAKLRSGFPFKSSSWVDDGVPVIKIANVKDGRIVADGCGYVSHETAATAREWMTQKGDVLIAMTGYVGEIARVRSGEKYLINQRVGRFDFLDDSPVIPEFFFYYLRQSEVRSLLETMARGSAQPNLSASDAAKLWVPVPPPAEQRAIAHILGKLDEKIELNRKQNETLEAMARALFKAWFVDFEPVRAKQEGRWQRGQSLPGLPGHLYDIFPDRLIESELGEIPEGWEMRSLDSIANYLNGLALQKFPPESETEFLPVIKIAQLRAGNTNGADKASTQIKPEYVVVDGDVLFSWSGSLEVEVWNGGRGALNQHLFKVTSNEVPKWFYFFATRQHLSDFRAIASGKATTMGHIQRKHLTDARIAVAPPESMKKFDAVIASQFDQLVSNAQQSRSLAQLRDTLLPKLISGELRVPDAERIVGAAV